MRLIVVFINFLLILNATATDVPQSFKLIKTQTSPKKRVDEYEDYYEDASPSTAQNQIDCKKNYNPQVFSDITKSFWSYSKIVRYLHYIACTYPKKTKLTAIGSTYENRTMYTLTIWLGLPKNNAIFVDAGMSAREWTSVMLALYIIHSLVEMKTNDDLTQIDWIILPVANPDGYVYSFKNPTYRMWRKNRHPSECPPICPKGMGCGVDIYKNFEYMFSGVGSSSNPCSNMYSGPNPNSELETVNIIKVLKQRAKEIKLYLGLHVFRGLFLYPFSNNPNPVHDYKDLENLAGNATEVINNIHKMKGAKYSFGNYASVLNPASGTPLDYVRGNLGVKYAYIIGLRKGINDPTGFAPDAKEIFSITSECFQGIHAMALVVYNEYPPSKSFLRKLKGYRRRRMNRECNKTAGFSLILILVFIISHVK